MNCSQKTNNGAHVPATNMTTLLQKNCIKTLQMNNGSVVVVGTTPVANIPISQQAQMINGNVVPITSAMSSATNLQTHTMIANASHLQPIQAFQYQQYQTVAAPSQPQYLIINPNDGTVFRPIVTTTTQPTAQIVSNTIYQTPQTFVTQNNLPKIGAIKYTNSASTQQKVLNIVTSLKATPQHQHQHQQQQQQQQQQNINNINTTNTIGQQKQQQKQPHIINNKTTTEHRNSHTFINSGGQQQQQQQRQIVSIANGNNVIGNIMSTTTTTSNQIVTSLNNTLYTAAHAAISNQQIIATTAKSNNIHAETLNTKHNNCSQMSIQSTTIKNESNNIIQKTIENVTTTSNAGSLMATKEEKIEEIKEEITQKEPCQSDERQQQQQQQQQQHQQPEQSDNPIEEENEPEPEIDIVINNVVCSFSVRCHLNLRQIALNGRNVEFRRENGMVTMKLRRPYTTASIWSSGRITCTGATSEDQAKVGARRYARCLQSLGFPVRFNSFRVVNVLGTCSMPWAIKIVNFSEKYKQDASYEPELHPGVTFKLKSPKATLKIFSTGSITVTAGSVADVQAAIEHIFPLVYEFRKKRTIETIAPPEVFDPDNENDDLIGDSETLQRHPGHNQSKPNKAIKRKYPFGHSENDPHEDNMVISEDELPEFYGLNHYRK